MIGRALHVLRIMDGDPAEEERIRSYCKRRDSPYPFTDGCELLVAVVHQVPVVHRCACVLWSVGSTILMVDGRRFKRSHSASVRRHRRTQRRAKIARRCLVRATCQRLVGTSFGCLALTNFKRLWGLPSGSGKGWTPVAAMMRTFMAAVPRQQTQPTCRERRSWLACSEFRVESSA